MITFYVRSNILLFDN